MGRIKVPGFPGQKKFMKPQLNEGEKAAPVLPATAESIK
jgi:hypothetical protein